MRPLVIALALLAAACTSSTGTSITSTTVSTTVPTTTVTGVTASPPPVDPCPSEEPGPAGAFTGTGQVGTVGSAAGDAAVISEIRLTTPRPGPGIDPDPEVCERLVIDLATAAGAPATAIGTTQVELLADLGIVRVFLPPAVAATAVADVTMAGHIADRAYVVETNDGLFVDVHLGLPAVARADTTRSPASIVVDLLGGGAVPAGRPAVGNAAVVLAPLGPTAGYPIEVTGYARSDTGTIEIEVAGASGPAEPVAVSALTFPWRAFSAVVPSGPSGSVRLTAGGAVVLLAVA